MTTGAIIKKLRRISGMGQKDLAVKIGVSVNSICSFETDKYMPSADNLKAISEALGVKMEDLFKK